MNQQAFYVYGTGYRFGFEEDFIYKIKGTEEFCLELYLRNPIEIDANNHAYSNLKKIIENNFIRYGDDDETMKNLQKTKGILLPKFNIIIDDIAVDIIKYCQTLIELSYQFSKGNINEIVYNTKSIEIYNAIKGLIDDKSHIKLSFNPNDVLCKNE